MELLLKPSAWLVVVLVSLLGTVGNLALYNIGKQGVEAVVSRFPQIDPERWKRVERLYEEHGSLVLLLSGVPVLGSLITTAAGAFGVELPAFLFLVIIAKMIRNWLLVVIPYEVYLLLTR